MNIKRTGLILFLVALMVFGLVACGVTTPTTEPATEAPTQPAKDTVSVVFMVGSEQYDVKTVEKGQKVAAPTAPAIAGQNFLGWFKSGATAAFDFNTAVDAALVLTAKFEYITYNITYVISDEEGTVTGFDASKVINPNVDTTYTAENVLKFANAKIDGNNAYIGTWVDADGNTVTDTNGLTGDLTLTTKWVKAPYIDLDFEGMKIHYADTTGCRTALDGTLQDQHSAPPKSNLFMMAGYEEGENGALRLSYDVSKGFYMLVEGFKTAHAPVYIRNDGDAHGNYYCVIIDKDLKDGSQDETYYYDKDGSKSHTTNGTDTLEGEGVYYCMANGEPANVGVLCRLQNNGTATGNVKLSFDFYFEEGMIYPLSFYIRNDASTSYGSALNGKRTNLAALTADGKIAIGVDAVGNTGRMSYKGTDGNTITERMNLGDAKAGEWNTIEFEMILQDNGTNYTVNITLNGDKIGDNLNLFVGDLTWDHATMFMIFGGGGSVKLDSLSHDLVYKFDNIKLVDAD